MISKRAYKVLLGTIFFLFLHEVKAQRISMGSLIQIPGTGIGMVKTSLDYLDPEQKIKIDGNNQLQWLIMNAEAGFKFSFDYKRFNLNAQLSIMKVQSIRLNVIETEVDVNLNSYTITHKEVKKTLDATLFGGGIPVYVKYTLTNRLKVRTHLLAGISMQFPYAIADDSRMEHLGIKKQLNFYSQVGAGIGLGEWKNFRHTISLVYDYQINSISTKDFTMNSFALKWEIGAPLIKRFNSSKIFVNEE